ncbi:hypothetical protein LVY74_16740 [Acinetobacter sp. ME22]|uniref:hypothetical protein n=1 Tax=Acinetobacter sp. ME22 TaxID=2904802 RepID=UPI001EDAA311|nr:hypothetical protein [Acinetobacter sp. ME22]MCG2575185.1 hypothetical protein [Acinetobacter sp. ME22]
MTDKVQSKKDLNYCCDELNKYQSLSRTGLTHKEHLAIDGIMVKLKERIKNLRIVLEK